MRCHAQPGVLLLTGIVLIYLMFPDSLSSLSPFLQGFTILAGCRRLFTRSLSCPETMGLEQGALHTAQLCFIKLHNSTSCLEKLETVQTKDISRWGIS